MGNLKVSQTGIEGLVIIEPVIYGDHRGYFMETWNQRDFENAGVQSVYVQDNQSRSFQGVLRGLHFQKKHPQGKLVRVLSGEVFDVAVDLRRDSVTFGKWKSVILSAENKKQFYIPEGLAHGFLVLSEAAEFFYKCTRYYAPEDEGGLAWNDPDIGIEWPKLRCSIQLSEKDLKNPWLKDMTDFPFL